MPHINQASAVEQSSWSRTDQEELAARIASALHDDGTIEVQPGLHYRRHSGPTEPVHASAQPSFCVIAQGRKVITLGSYLFSYDTAHYLVTSMELPLTGKVVEATPEYPYLSFRLVLDPSVVTSVMIEAELVQTKSEANVKAVDVSPLDADLLDATVRLVRLVARPHEYRVLAPLVIREIVYRLLIGAQGHRMSHLARLGGHAHRMARAVEMVRKNFDKPIRIEELAKELSMSVSGFHAHFKAVTAMSPLQFQKQIRLQEARRLMISEQLDAAQAGFRVGYEDASHFNRDYKRHFGKPPLQDVKQSRDFLNAAEVH